MRNSINFLKDVAKSMKSKNIAWNINDSDWTQKQNKAVSKTVSNN